MATHRIACQILSALWVAATRARVPAAASVRDVMINEMNRTGSNCFARLYLFNPPGSLCYPKKKLQSSQVVIATDHKRSQSLPLLDAAMVE